MNVYVIASEASFLVCSMRGFSIYLYIYFRPYVVIASEASFLVCSMRGFSIIYIFQAVRRAVNETFETPDTVFNNLELLVIASEASFLVCSMRGFSIYLYIYFRPYVVP